MQKIKAEIELIKSITPKIKLFKIKHHFENYQFKPGQWIDLTLPIEGKNIGGYTIISSINQKKCIDLAIRESSHHPVTIHLHQNSKIGDEVEITLGQGQFYLKEEWFNLPKVFIAGGIGLTPILSMIRSCPNRKMSKLFYSAGFEEELMFKEELEDIAVFSTTKSSSPKWRGETTRIDLVMLKKYLKEFDAHYFICGPRPMIDGLSSELKNHGVNREFIHYEKWW